MSTKFVARVLWLFVIQYFPSTLLASFEPNSCRTKILNLSRAKSYISSLYPLDPYAYPKENGYDGNYATTIHSDAGPNEWYMLYVNAEKYQLIHTVSIVPRTEHAECIKYRSSNIDISLAFKLSRVIEKKVGETHMPWHEFKYCGTTPETFDIVASVRCKQVINARYIAFRLSPKQTVSDHMVMNFGEIVVNILDLASDVPIFDQPKCYEGASRTISTSCSSTNIIYRRVWYEQFLNGTHNLLPQEGSQIHFNSIVGQAPRRFYFELHDVDNSVVYTSNVTELVHTSYASATLTIDPKESVKVKENDLIDITCTSDAGHPHPNLLLVLDDIQGNSSLGNEDLHGGHSAHAHLRVPAQLKWNGKLVTCTRIQAGYPNVTKHIVLHVVDKKFGVTYNRSLPSTYRKALLHPTDYLMLNLTRYIKSALPDEFNITCSKNDETFFVLVNKHFADSRIRLFELGNYVCHIDHETFKRVMRVLLYKVANNQTCNCC